MKNYKMIIQYDGSRYKGWQRLGDDDDTIQGKIEKVLSKLTGKRVEIVGCSRTDAGVHALAQVANFKTARSFTEAEIHKYLNTYLSHDISITEVTLVPDRFHSRYNAKDKTYLYKIWNKEYTNPFMRKYSMHIEKRLHIPTMKKASQYFVGEHDFTAFSNAKSKKKSMVRVIDSISIEQDNGLIEIRVQGNELLNNMVRKIVGMLIDVGAGEIEVTDVLKIIDSEERSQTGCVAEPCGLYLEKVTY